MGDQPTMNLGMLTQAISDETFQQLVLHEFRHVLGLIHEHQNPNADIPWNKEAVYSFFTGPPNDWSRDVVYLNIFKKYRGKYREFDPPSIMMFFPITQAFLTGNTFQPIPVLSKVLSERDKKLISELYPQTQSTE